MEPRIKIIFYWVLIGICMILHTQFSQMGLFFGESITMPEATGTMPDGMYYFLVVGMIFPFIFSLLHLNVRAKWFVWISFIWSCLLIILNVYHFCETMFVEHAHVDQGCLLLFVLVINVLLTLDLYRMIRRPAADSPK